MPATRLLLSATPASWAVRAEHGTIWDENPKMKAVRAKILSRDGNTCQGCGWVADDHQEIHHRNDDHRDFSESNLETLCPLCHQVFHLPLAASTSGGTLLWLPEITQADLNLMCIPWFVAMKNHVHPYRNVALQLHSSLENRGVLLGEKFGTSDPGVLAQILIKLSPAEYANRETLVGNLRLLPRPNRFPAAIDYWESACFRNPPADRWAELMPESLRPGAP